jgi:hypothetical protein
LAVQPFRYSSKVFVHSHNDIGQLRKNDWLSSLLALEGHYRRNYSLILWILLLGLIGFGICSSYFRIDQVARATGEVIASSLVQIIQAVDGVFCRP